ncbi:type-F conjugative transfer system secretin TraK [Luteimonas sp. BDR2-5]|uniref:TraK domain-containing protein n=1 Tax=Proluteimonas luteida TaxID=2878685 RepID=UPI001E56E1E8|nr:type-F conjugative transfer system secretin TraK [Luteimonas sp. BDR2-5]MCD9026738.1 type-F conjugative transfer system secretin TraK [Luteimonas sp. BDR2-5]
MLAGGLLVLLAPLAAHAEQIVEVRDGAAVEALVSLREPTRVRIEGAAIREVFGNLQSGNCGATPAVGAGPGTNAAPAEILVECDLDKGEIYLRPVGVPDKPINLFVSSPHATYTLLLRPVDRPADTLVLRDRTLPATEPAAAVLGAAANPIRRLKGLLVAMASGQAPPDIRTEAVDRDVPLWAQVRFTFQRRFEGRGLIGEHYVLHNLGSDVMVLAEQEFHREGGNVAGVAIEHHNLRPGDRTNVYVLRFGARP